jgi:selenide,water dikinase
LVLTKPIGTGVLISAYRRGWLDEASSHELVRQMAALNDIAGRAAVSHEARAATDITGFGLAGHARELAVRSGVAVRLWFQEIPRYAEAFTLSERGAQTVITSANQRDVAGSILVAGDISAIDEMLLYDPQTSGGLLVSLPPDEAVAYVEELRSAGVEDAAIVGEVLEAREPCLEVTRGR